MGPFDFISGHVVPPVAFDKLLSVAGDLGIYVGNVNRVVPLDKPDEEDRDGQGTPTSHLAFRWNIMDGSE